MHSGVLQGSLLVKNRSIACTIHVKHARYFQVSVEKCYPQTPVHIIQRAPCSVPRHATGFDELCALLHVQPTTNSCFIYDKHCNYKFLRKGGNNYVKRST